MISRHTFSRIFLCLLISTGLWFSYSVSALSFKELLGIGTDETDEAIPAETEKKQEKSTAKKQANQ